MWLTVIPDELNVKLVPCDSCVLRRDHVTASFTEPHLHLHNDCEDGNAIVPFPIMSNMGMARLLRILDRIDCGWYLQMLPILLKAPEAQNLPNALSFLERRILHQDTLTKAVLTFCYVSGGR